MRYFYPKVILLSVVASFVVGVFSDLVGRQFVQVRLYFGRGDAKAVLFSSENEDRSVGLFLTSPDGSQRASLTVDGVTGDASLHLRDGGPGLGGLGLLAKADGSAVLGMLDREGKNRLTLKVAPDGSNSMTMLDGEGRARINITVSDKGSPSLHFYDAEGKVIYSAP